jgi:uncharacterized protein (TIGR04255 family)
LKDEKYQKLTKQPLSLVLTEFRFSEVRKIAGYIPDIQEALRRDYPVYSESQSQSVNISPQGVAVDRQVSSWILGTQDKSRAIEISDNRLVFFSTDYDRFDAYEDECISAVGILHDIVKLGLLIRIGLRYNDVIHPIEEGDRLNSYVIPELCISKELSMLGSAVIRNRTESSIQTEEGILTVRSMEGVHGLVTMPDLNKQLPVKTRDDIPEESPRLILDFDHIWHAPEPGDEFVIDLARARLSSLHETARQAFWSVTTEHARNNRWA